LFFKWEFVLPVPKLESIFKIVGEFYPTNLRVNFILKGIPSEHPPFANTASFYNYIAAVFQSFKVFTLKPATLRMSQFFLNLNSFSNLNPIYTNYKLVKRV